MDSSATASFSNAAANSERGSTRHILGFVSFTFIVYLSIGLPLSVLPPFIHLRMGYSAFLAGLAISVQYIATLASRPWAGRISDHLGAKVSVMWGMAACTASGAMVIATAALHNLRWASFVVLVASRLLIGIGESLGSTGSTLWGINAAGPEHTAKVIGWNGVTTYAGIGLGAPLGVILDQQWGLSAIGAVTIVVCGVSLLLASRKLAVPVVAGEHLPFAHVVGRVLPHGIGLALAQVTYNVLATFITLYYLSRHWSGAALCLTAFAVVLIVARLLFIRTIGVFGGYPVAKITIFIESIGALMLWLANSPTMAIAGAAICGLGFSLVFPSIGVEAVERVPEFNRGTALGIYTAFADVSFFMVGPIAGALIGWYGYSSVFLFALVSNLAAIGIVFTLHRLKNLRLSSPAESN
jgi:MFS family permease